MKRNAALGYWNGSVPPFGYRTVEVGKKGDKAKKILEIESEEAAIVRKMCDLYLHGDSEGAEPEEGGAANRVGTDVAGRHRPL